ncbi:MAG: AraC family transcriptional regulator, partial [Vibrionaceae bacterium]
YLAAWAIATLAGTQAASEAMFYVAPVGEKEQTVQHAMSVILPFIDA